MDWVESAHSPGGQGKGGRCRRTPAGESPREPRVTTSTTAEIKQVSGTEAPGRTLLEEPPQTERDQSVHCLRQRERNQHGRSYEGGEEDLCRSRSREIYDDTSNSAGLLLSSSSPEFL